MADIVSEEDFAKAQAYGADKSRFDFVATAYGQIQSVAMITYDWLPILWDFSGSLMYKYGGFGPEYEVRIQGALHVAFFFFVFTMAHTL